MPDFTTAVAVAIFAATCVIVALGKIPVFRIDRGRRGAAGRQPDGGLRRSRTG